MNNEALPTLDEPHWLMRLKPDANGRLPSDPPSTSFFTVGPEWQAIPVDHVMHNRDRLGWWLADHPGGLEMRLVDDGIAEQIAKRAERMGGAVQKTYQKARKAWTKAQAALVERTVALEAAVEEFHSADSALDAAELSFGAGESDWAAVEAATGRKKQAEARMRFAERALAEADEAVDAVTAERHRAEFGAASTLVAEEAVHTAIDEALKPALEAWPAVLAALGDAMRVSKAFQRDDEEARELSKVVRMMDTDHNLEGLPDPAWRVHKPETLLLKRFASLTGTDLGPEIIKQAVAVKAGA